MLKRWALPILIVYVLALTIGSLSHIGALPTLGSSFDDKITHFLAYALLTILSYNFLRIRPYKYALISAVVLAVVYGIIIEGLQSVLTDFRTPDVFDVVANTLGAFTAYVLMLLQRKLKLK